MDAQLANAGAASADNQTVQQYNEQLAKLEQTRIAYLEKYTEKHPKMIELNDQIANLKQKVAEEKARVANLQAPSDNKVHQELVAKKFASQTEVAIAQQKAESLRNALTKDNEDFDKYSALQKEYARLAREASVAKEIHAMLAKRVENHLGMAVLGCIPDAAAFDRAEAQGTEAESGFIGKMKEFLWKKQD